MNIRQIMSRGARGRNIRDVIDDINKYLLGCDNYFLLAELKQSLDITPRDKTYPNTLGYGAYPPAMISVI